MTVPNDEAAFDAWYDSACIKTFTPAAMKQAWLACAEQHRDQVARLEAERDNYKNGLDQECLLRKVDNTRLEAELAKWCGAALEQTEKLIELEAHRDALAARVGVLEGALDEYGRHLPECVLSFYEAGRPTDDGGYEQKYKGIWYEVRPNDKTPNCNCGFNAALSADKKEGSDG